MRAVNLIPPEERHGERAPARTGAAVYVLVAGLALVLGAVTMVVLTNNKISDRKAEITTLKAQEAAAKTEASRLSAYANFASIAESRDATVSTLARSRFDWDRVLRELAIVIPSDVWLTDIKAAVSANAQVASSSSGETSTGTDLSATIAGPSLQLTGCAAGHDAVAVFAASLEDIDGVTRVGIASSQLPDQAQTGGASTSADCRTRDFISKFAITVAFDSVQVDATSGLPVPPAPTDDGGVAEARASEQQGRDSIQQQTDRAREAVGLIPGTVR